MSGDRWAAGNGLGHALKGVLDGTGDVSKPCTSGSAPAPRWGHTMESYDTERAGGWGREPLASSHGDGDVQELVVFGGIAQESALLSDEGVRGPVQPPFAREPQNPTGPCTGLW